nr:calcium-binding protein [Massilia frigida]
MFGKGDGQDTLVAVLSPGGIGSTVDTLQFKAGIAGSDLQFSAVDRSLLIKIAGTSDQITVNSFISQESPTQFSPLQQIRFADGVTWDVKKIQAELLADTTLAPVSAAWIDVGTHQPDVALIGEIPAML